MTDPITPTTPEVVPTTSTTPESTIAVDIYGTSVELPISKAKEIIAKRDSKTQEYRELSGKVQDAEKRAKNEAERATLIEKMKANDIESVKELASKEYKTKLENLQSKVIETAIKAEFSQLEGFNNAYVNDALQLFKANNPVSFDDKEEIVANGKALKESIAEFAKTKEIFFGKKVSSTGISPSKIGVQGKQNVSQGVNNPFDGLAKALKDSPFQK